MDFKPSSSIRKKALSEVHKALSKSLIDVISIPQVTNKKRERILTELPSIYYHPVYFSINHVLRDCVENDDWNTYWNVFEFLSQFKKNELSLCSFPNFRYSLNEFEDIVMINFITSSIQSSLNKKVFIEPLSYKSFLVESITLKKAFSSIEMIDPELHTEIVECVSAVNFMEASGIVGASSSRAFGSIYIRCPEQSEDESIRHLYYVEHLIHEAAHTYLNALTSLDLLLLNDTEKLYSSPLRTDPRPLKNVLHAVFVLSRLIYCFYRIPEESAKKMLPNFLSEFDDGMDVLQQEGDYTIIGREFLQSMSNFRKSINI